MHEDTPLVGIDSALQVSTVWACVVLMVDNLSSLPVEVYITNDNGEKEKDTTSRLYQVMHESPNRRQTSMEFWSVMWVNFLLRGNAYARIIRDNNGEVVRCSFSAD